VVTDQRMPEMSGLELLRHIKEIDPSTVRILVTGYSDINVVIQALNEGLVWRYVTKPWDHGELRALVMAGARAYLKEHGLDAQAFRFDGLLGA
jgi:response regulator RpfG family c-di-GMP phosphodiesterase